MGKEIQKNKSQDKHYNKDLNLSAVSEKTFKMNQLRKETMDQKQFDYQTEISKNVHMFDQLKGNKKAYSEFMEHSMQYTSRESQNEKQLKAIEKEAGKVSERSQKRRDHHLKKMNSYGQELQKGFLADDQSQEQGPFAEFMNSLDLMKNMFKYQMHFIRLYGKKDALEKMQEDALRVACILKMEETIREFKKLEIKMTPAQIAELAERSRWIQDEQKNIKNKTEAETQQEKFQQWSGRTKIENENKYQFSEHHKHDNIIIGQKNELVSKQQQVNKKRQEIQKERNLKYANEHRDYQSLRNIPKEYKSLLQDNFKHADDYCQKMIEGSGLNTKDFEMRLKKKLTSSGVDEMQKEEVLIALRMADCCCYGQTGFGFELDCYSQYKAFLFMARRYPEKVMADQNLLQEGRLVLKSFLTKLPNELFDSLSMVTMDAIQEQEKNILKNPTNYTISRHVQKAGTMFSPNYAEGNYLASFETLKEMYQLQKLKNHAKENLGINQESGIFMKNTPPLRTIKTNQDWKLNISFNSVEEYDNLGKKVMEGLMKKNLEFKILNPEYFSKEQFEVNNAWAKQITIYPNNEAFYTMNEDGSWISKEVDEILFGSSSKDARASSSDQVIQHDGHGTRVTARCSSDFGYLIDKNNHYCVDDRTITANEMAEQYGGYTNSTLEDIITFPTAMREATIGHNDLKKRFGEGISSISQEDILKLKRYGQSMFLCRNDSKAEEADMIYDFYMVDSLEEAKSMEVPGLMMGPGNATSALAYVPVPETGKYLVGILKEFFVEDVQMRDVIAKKFDPFRI